MWLAQSKVWEKKKSVGSGDEKTANGFMGALGILDDSPSVRKGRKGMRLNRMSPNEHRRKKCFPKAERHIKQRERERERERERDRKVENRGV